MTFLVECLGEVVSLKIKDSSASLYLACTVEDADYFAKSMLTSLGKSFQLVNLACF